MEQLNLFTYEKEEKRASMTEAVQSMKKKYGKDVFVDISDIHSPNHNDKLLRTSFQKDFLDDYKQNDPDN